ncbi:ATP-binding protein [Leptonema illini]|uniref:histidine kinase n=1 Tax=Leptonema illini DSM 21528 TaxID=929563 RepID=H2CFK0_9LEPT|nr:ATP-binding protein [Leptonema illini]EHQ05665.1 multi-sensor hybrid histidine kinase [Leptonema illini DSM 21528]
MHRSQLLTIWLSGLLATAAAFFLGRSLENTGLEARFRPAAENQASRLANGYKDYFQEADAVRRLFESSASVNEAEFAAFTRPAIESRPGIHGFYFVSANLEGGVRILYSEERHAPTGGIPRDLLANALRSGKMVASPPKNDTLILAVPVYTQLKQATGIVVVIIEIAALLDETVKRQIQPLPVEWFDVSATPGHQQVISWSPDAVEVPSVLMIDPSPALSHTFFFNEAGRSYRIDVRGTPDYVMTHRSFLYWWAIPAGLILTSLVSVFLREYNRRQSSEEKFRTMSNYTGDWEYWIDPDRNIVYMSPSCESLSGYRSEEFMKDPGLIERIVHVEDRPAFIKHLGEYHGGNLTHLESFHRSEFRIIHKDGELRWMEHVCRPVFAPDGRFLGRRISNRDVTDRHQFQQALLFAKEEAEKADRAKSAFLATMSHEIRTPIHGIVGLADLVLAEQVTDSSSLSSSVQGDVKNIRESALELLEVLDDILDFSRIESDMLTLDTKPFVLAELIERMMRPLQVRAEQKGVQCLWKIDPVVPTTVFGDGGRLRQILLNLLSNALKFTEHGEIELRVQPAFDDLIRFTVRDTGIGMSGEALPRIFDRFYQIDQSTHRRYPGSGLGLSIAKKLVELMGGGIRVHSEIGKGTTFIVEIPLPGTPSVKSSESSSLSEAFRADPGTRALIVEDDPLNREILRRQLKSMGFEVDEATDGSEALDRLEQTDYAVVLMDVHMPVMDGYTATIAIRNREAQSGGHRCIIALTADAMKGDRERCLEVGMDDYLAKPFRPSELKEVLYRNLN